MSGVAVNGVEQTVKVDWDYYIFKVGAVVYAHETATGRLPYSDADATVVYNLCRVAVEVLLGGHIHFAKQDFPFSAKIYVQCEPGGALPSYQSFCKITGEGAEQISGTDQGTFLNFAAGVDGLIVDMHTNDGQWYTGSSIKNLTIGGTGGNIMGEAISITKSAHLVVEDIVIRYAGAGPGPCFSAVNVQDHTFKRIRIILSLNGSTGFYRANIDGVGPGYTEQGAHGLWENCKSGIPTLSSLGTPSTGMRNFHICVVSGAAVLSQETFINCESMNSADSGGGAANIGWKFGNGADTSGMRAFNLIGCNYEGGTYASGDRGILCDANAKIVRVKISGGFAGGSSIELNNDQEKFILDTVEPEPDTINASAGGYLFLRNTDTPTTVVAGTKWRRANGINASVLVFIADANQPANVTRFYGPGGAVAGAEGGVGFHFPFDALVRNLKCHATSAPGGADTYIFTFRAGGDTLLTATITGAAIFAEDVTNEIAVSEDDLSSMKIVSSATASVDKVNAAVEVEVVWG